MLWLWLAFIFYLSTCQRNFANAIVSGGGDCVYSVWVAGAVCLFVAHVVPFAVIWLERAKKCLCSLSYVPFTLLLAWGAVRSGVMAQMERGCTSANLL